MNIEEQKAQIKNKMQKFLNPATFDKITLEKNLTPEQYYKQYLDFLPDDFIELIKNNTS